MTRMVSARTWLLAMLGLSLMVACAQAPQSTPIMTVADSKLDQTVPLKFFYISPDPIGDNPFLKLGKIGLEQAGRKYGAEVKILESHDPQSREANVRAATDAGAGIVIVLGFQFGHIIPIVAAENPNIHFLIVDQCIDLPAANVHCAVFREHEAAFLIGVAAGSLTQSDKVGVISAVDIPFLHRYSDAFAAGAKYVNPAVEIIPPRWVGGEHPFADPERAKALALELAAEGADQIFAATSAGNVGVFEAARQENFLTYGVDVNECQLAPGWVVDSTIKRVDVAIVAAVDQIIQGSNENLIAFGLAEEGMNIVSLTTTDIATSECLIAKSPELIEQLRTVREKIVSGEITVHDPLTEP